MIQHSSKTILCFAVFRLRRLRLLVLLVALWALEPCFAVTDQPFGISAVLKSLTPSEAELTVNVTIPPGHRLYADKFRVEAPGALELVPKTLPEAKTEADQFTGEKNKFFSRDFSAVYLVRHGAITSLPVTVSFYGCNRTMCFLPQSLTFNLAVTGSPPSEAREAPVVKGQGIAQDDWRPVLSRFKIVAVRSGYLKPKDFLHFLDLTESHDVESGAGNALERALNSGRLWIAFALILLFGLALNLTPCVLPMIPINLAIIGAGSHAGSRRRGFMLGSLYGAGMAIAYGLLGLVVVLTGSTFGAINASAWFNFGIAVLFLVLSLAMFDVLRIDFSRLQGNMRNLGGGAFAVLFMGAMVAILSGACVAPVVITVLLLSADFYAKGYIAGLFLPFLLGIGMALPWPLAGAGLSLLPKPGRWMVWVKKIFGVFILIIALNYIYNGFMIVRRQSGTEQISLPDALRLAEREKKLVFIEFGASWCDSCRAMKLTTLKDPEVRRQLQSFVSVSYMADQPGDSPHREILREFGVIGFPTHVILKLR